MTNNDPVHRARSRSERLLVQALMCGQFDDDRITAILVESGLATLWTTSQLVIHAARILDWRDRAKAADLERHGSLGVAAWHRIHRAHRAIHEPLRLPIHGRIGVD